MKKWYTDGSYGAKGLFGLRCGQLRGKQVAHNGGWYNGLGEKIGWGDLSQDDLSRIASQLPLPQGEGLARSNL